MRDDDSLLREFIEDINSPNPYKEALHDDLKFLIKTFLKFLVIRKKKY